MVEQNIIENKPTGNFEEFLLNNPYARLAFINLSKKSDDISKDELLEEIKKLIREKITEQIRV
ncbi:MAG: hypothetical protein A2Y97_12020 [Nitrospirae bacterium RBG_13_39_12]|nr:MAG: hypothetical protein A2Y97_12020 [Nitrospirae bacterium RBG_13_39_12]